MRFNERRVGGVQWAVGRAAARGFTLIELMIVVVILGLLSSIAVYSYTRYLDRAKQQTPNSVHVSVDNFMNSPRYDEVVELVRDQHQDGV